MIKALFPFCRVGSSLPLPLTHCAYFPKCWIDCGQVERALALLEALTTRRKKGEKDEAAAAVGSDTASDGLPSLLSIQFCNTVLAGIHARPSFVGDDAHSQRKKP